MEGLVKSEVLTTALENGVLRCFRVMHQLGNNREIAMAAIQGNLEICRGPRIS